MNPILKEIRNYIKEINKINKEIFPLRIPGGVYTKPNSSFFKHAYVWNFISDKYGYLSTMDSCPSNDDGYAGCSVAYFNDNVKELVRDILKKKLEELKNG